MMTPARHPGGDRSDNAGAALIIVLAFVVLLSGLIVAYFVRTTVDRQLARSSFDNTAADILARSALDIIVGDFKQEIVAGSTGPAGAYALTSNAYIVPMRSGNPANVPNLVRRSIRNDPIASPPAIGSRASALNSTDDVSLNGRSVSLARWNKHYLIPRLNAGSTTVDTIPIGEFTAPDWVLVSNLGPGIKTAPDASVLGRYAYAVYDEGGLLDMNVAGFPSANSSDLTYLKTIGRKGVLAFADLSATGLSASVNGAIDNMIGWGNYLSGLPVGSYSMFSFPANPTNFVSYFLDTTRNFGTIATPATYSAANPRTDQAFINRNTLLELRRTLTSAQDAMQYLGTFSRELNKSTWNDSGTKLAARFPLSRFDLFAATPPSVANKTLIQTYFGLIYVSAAGPTTPEHWQYCGTSGTILRSTIPSVNGTNQNPDLFPLLQYALPSASMSEILSIGASLIDQRDADSNTTWIEYGAPAAPSKAFGVDSIPSADPTSPPPPSSPVMLKRSFRNVGELGYAYRNSSTTLDFRASGSQDGPLLDLFTYNTASPRSGIINLNTQNPGVLAAIIKGAFATEASSSGINLSLSNDTAHKIIKDAANGTAANPVIGRQDVARLTAAAGPTIGSSEEAQEAVARALTEMGQTRTWGLMIDVIAQSGRYPPTASGLANFVVEGEKRYWLHVAIDRLTGQVIDQQLEAVYE
jgi:hypothetical protein